MSNQGIPIFKSLCSDYIPASDYVDGKPQNCFTCDYGSGTKCEDMHRALNNSENKHQAYSYMVSSNRSAWF